MAIKKDDVFRVADEMFADGVSPSLVGIRAKLGSGSFSTISGYLAEWKSASRSAPLVGVEDVPEEVEGVFAPALRSMWAMAQQLASVENDKSVKICEEKMQAAYGRENEALELAQLLQIENEALIAAAMAAEANAQEGRELVIRLRQSCAECRAREDELRKQHSALLAKIRPISVRKDRGDLPGAKARRILSPLSKA